MGIGAQHLSLYFIIFMQIVKAFPVAGAKLGQCWFYQYENGTVSGQFSYQSLQIEFSGFADSASLRSHLLDRLIATSAQKECLDCYNNYQQICNSINDALPRGVDLMKLGEVDTSKFQPLIQELIHATATKLKTLVDSPDPQSSTQIGTLNELLKTVLHYDTVTTTIKTVTDPIKAATDDVKI